MNEHVEDMTEERDEWIHKCKEVTKRLESMQKENEKLAY